MYRRLRANQDGIVSATQAAQLVAPAEGEALITADGATVTEAARAAELDELVMARGAMQTVRPKSVRRVPGPSTDQAALPVEHLPSPQPLPDYTSGGGVRPYLPAARETPEQADAFPADAAAGLPVVGREQQGWPWWLLVLGAGIAWMALKKR